MSAPQDCSLNLVLYQQTRMSFCRVSFLLIFLFPFLLRRTQQSLISVTTVTHEPNLISLSSLDIAVGAAIIADWYDIRNDKRFQSSISG